MLTKSKPPSKAMSRYNLLPQTDGNRHGLNFIKLDGDIGCLGWSTLADP